MKVSKKKDSALFVRLYDYQVQYIKKISVPLKITNSDVVRKIIDRCIYEDSKNNK